MQILLFVEGEFPVDDNATVPYEERANHAVVKAARAAVAELESNGVIVAVATLSSGHFFGGVLNLLEEEVKASEP